MKKSKLELRKRIILCVHFSLIVVNAIVIPPPRYGHISVLCGSKLYIHGGHTGVNHLTAPIGSDLYSLDMSTPFDSFSVPWVQLTPGPYASFHSAGLNGAENNLLAIYGGNSTFTSTSTGSSSNSLNLYDTTSGTWTPSPLQDPPRREQQKAVSRLGDGTMFVFGGMILSPDLLTETSTSELWTLGGYINSNNSTSNSTSTNSTSQEPKGLSPVTVGWQKLDESGSQVTDRSYHTATLIRSNGLLVIIGGVSSGALTSMSDILVYDTTAGTWSQQMATGATPPSRRNHVAVATSTGQIYIHGGTDLGATTFFADLAILDTTSWSWSQPAIEGNPPTGRYSHAATMIGSNMIVTFGLTAGDSTNNIFILDTASNTWQSSYTPNNLAQTSTKPEDWPGYKPPPMSPSTPPQSSHTSGPQSDERKVPSIGSIVGIVIGIAIVTALLVIFVRRRRYKQRMDHQAKFASLYGPEFTNQRRYQLEEAYAPTGMAFDSAPSSFGQRMEQLWNNMGVATLWRGDRRSANRSQSHRLQDQDDGGMRGLEVGPITDQDIFLDAVHRARSRVGRLSPVFVPLQQPIRSSSPTTPQSPLSPKLPFAGAGNSNRQSMATTVTTTTEYESIDDSSGVHYRSYSDGFENSMQDMDVQMVAIPKGRLYVVNPSDETLIQDTSLRNHP
ncbi:hypothetical protein BGZ76_005077 [Entomortierella beljakovae]|nr:hypothetical protein BGZ76_005077 [Entomortierella beljakovae]